MKIKKYSHFLESKEVFFVDDNKEKISQNEMDLIANIIKYFDSEADIKDSPGWEDVEGYVSCVTPDEIHFGVKYDFHHLDGEVDRNSEVVIIDRKSGNWTHQPEEITESFINESVDIQRNLDIIKNRLLDNDLLDESKMNEIIEWFFDNNYTFMGEKFPTPLMKVIEDKFGIGSNVSMSMVTILSYEDLLRDSDINESLKSKSDKGNRYFRMLKTGMFQHYDSPKGKLSKIGGEEDRKRLVSKLSKEDKKTYKEWLKTKDGEDSLLNFK